MPNEPSLLDIEHFPVMLDEIIKICSPKRGSTFLDCTFGGGGYSKKILQFSQTKVIALDRDEYIFKIAKSLEKKYPKRFTFFHKKFSELDSIVQGQKIDVAIFDLGLSSYQLKNLKRGFSFKSKESLDMSMGLSTISAEQVINKCSEQKLKLIIKVLGEEREASKIVKNIVRARKIKKISTVKELVEIIKMSKKKNYSKKINVSTKTFQALRIFVNKETTELIKGISKAAKIIKPGGKIIVISFHSIEDKIVKYFFSNYSSNKSKPSRYFPESNNLNTFLFDEYKNKIFKPSEKEISKNPPSRSAKLRFAIRSSNEFTYPHDLIKNFKKYLDLEGLYA